MCAGNRQYNNAFEISKFSIMAASFLLETLPQTYVGGVLVPRGRYAGGKDVDLSAKFQDAKSNCHANANRSPTTTSNYLIRKHCHNCYRNSCAVLIIIQLI